MSKSTFIDTVIVVSNDEDPEVGGYFAYFNTVDKNHWRGFGKTRLEAIACLAAVVADQFGETWPKSEERFV